MYFHELSRDAAVHYDTGPTRYREVVLTAFDRSLSTCQAKSIGAHHTSAFRNENLCIVAFVHRGFALQSVLVGGTNKRSK